MEPGARDDGDPGVVEEAAGVEDVGRDALGLGGFDGRCGEVDPGEEVDCPLYFVAGHALQTAERVLQGL